MGKVKIFFFILLALLVKMTFPRIPCLPADSLTTSLSGEPDTSYQIQDSVSKSDTCRQQDLLGLIFKKRTFDTEIHARRFSAIIIPLIGLSPSTGFSIGGGSSLSWRFGRYPETKLSAGVASIMVTTKKQLIFQFKTNVYLSRNKWFFQNDWRVYLYRTPAFGLGTGPSENIPEIPGDPSEIVNTVALQGRYPMQFNWIKFHNIMSRAITEHCFVGLGYHLDYHFDIDDQELVTDSVGYRPTPHYAYCRLHGFDNIRYLSSGMSLNFVFDNRDNLINAYKGFYINVNYRYNAKILGSSSNGSRLWTDFRTYVGLSKKIPRHVLAFWVYGSFMVSGHIPYLELMSNGFDQMNSSGRGYEQGRWRGENLVYGEVEYRFPISPCSGIIGGVLFANVITASNHDMGIPLFGFFKPGAGFGVRIMLSKEDRTNLLIDFGLGQQSQGFYLQAQEIF